MTVREWQRRVIALEEEVEKLKAQVSAMLLASSGGPPQEDSLADRARHVKEIGFPKKGKGPRFKASRRSS